MARVGAARLAVLAGLDDREDLVPRARAGQAALVFQQHVLGMVPAQARRDAATAGLLRPEVGDLPRIGRAYAAGDILRGHVDVVVRAHRVLGAAAREVPVPLAELSQVHLDPAVTIPASPLERGPGTDPAPGTEPGSGEEGADPLGEVLAELAAEAGPFACSVPQVRVVDAVLAHYARVLTVPELAVLAAASCRP
jgi:hypothetical protein